MDAPPPWDHADPAPAADRRPRVLFVTPWYPSEDRLAYGVYVREHAKAVATFADVRVLHLDGHARPQRGLYEATWVSDERITEGIPTYRARWRLTPAALPDLPLRTLTAMMTYREIALDFKPDVIHAHVFSAGLVAGLLGRLTRTPVVITEHTTKFAHPKVSWPTRAEAFVAYRLARHVLPVSEYLLHELQRQRLPGRFQVVPNVVDTELFTPRTLGPATGGTHRLLFVGALRNDHGKGLPDLLSALHILCENGMLLQLEVLGDGPKRQELEAMTRDLGLEHAVTFRGAVLKETVAEMVRNSDLVVMPSSNCIETFCIPVAEAQAAGVPTVATTVGAIPDTLGDSAGILVPPGSPKDLANAIEEALARDWDPELIAAGAQRFSVPTVGAALNEVYRSVATDEAT